ncbi:MAG: FCSD flavin-binding domain-containing protein [Minwuia sp.]|uniref:FCSD flavin-binding domain-containing protein n=1 Tax=Minwuia sp. TaxID=2493630 RepID=UPI003A842C75
MTISRRRFGRLAGAVAVTAAAPVGFVRGQARPKVVVIGGGAGGATAARYIAKDSEGAIDVTLIEPTRKYYTCFFSNLYLGGFRDLPSIGHTYDKLASEYGINVVHDVATGVDRGAKTVTLSSGGVLSYDALVVSPGIAFKFKDLPGYSVEAANRMPHAYKAGTQTTLLKNMINAMPEGGTFLMVAPPNPYRCPPGPYERVSMVAHVLKQKNPTAKILIIDPKTKFSKGALFSEGWQKHYTGMVEWIGNDVHGGIKSVNADDMSVTTDFDTFKGDVVNVIPPQRAGNIAKVAGLTDESGWCPIVPATMQSKMDPAVWVLGDATIAGDMPKSGFSANSQAKVCAMTVRGALTGSKTFPARFRNTCWSLIEADDGVKVGANYEATDEKIASTDSFISKTGESADLRKQTYEESVGWYNGITADMFG